MLNKLIMLIPAVLLMLGISEPHSMAYAETEGQACDRLAALEADPSHTSEPVAFDDIDSVAVISACMQAITVGQGDNRRYWLQLGRGYLRAGDIDAAYAAFETSHQQHYPAATFALGMMYFLGDDIAEDHDRAVSLFNRAYADGVFWAALGMAELYADPMSLYHDEQLSNHWREKFQQAVNAGG